MDQLLKTAVEAAKEAGKIQMEYLGKEIKVDYKGEIDLVTEVDKSCEKKIISIIKDSYPEHNFLAEEDTNKEVSANKYRWIIDPLDGTTNYAHGYRFFCTSIALEEDSNIILGVVYDPVTDELFHAQKGEGAFSNGKKINVSNTKELNKSLLCTGFPYDIRQDSRNNIEYFNKFVVKAQAVRRDGAAALDLCYIAAGRFDGFWELKLHPWDIAAGMLIIKEAGGTVTSFENKKINIFNGDIVASNGLIHDEMMKILL